MDSKKPPFKITNSILDKITEIAELVGQVTVTSGLNTNPMLRRTNRIRTIYSSLAIEQNTLSLEQVTAVLNGKRIIAPPKDITEVKNAYEIYEVMDSLNPYSVDDLLKAHEIMTKSLVDESGRFRSGSVGVVDKNGRVLHHGTILFDSDVSVLSSALHVDPEKIKSKAIKSVKSRVANIKELLCTDLSVIEFRDIIAKHIEKEFDADRIEAPSSLEIDKIYERNASSDWIFPNRDLLSKYTLNFKKRFDFGIIEFCFSMRNELVESLRIYGDFFEINPVFGLEESFSGKTISEIKIGYKNFKIEN
jgi:hypothetical protein